MGKVTTGATMSLDGYIAGPGETGFDLLFAWYAANNDESADHLRDVRESIGVLVVGRHLFDFTDGWGGRHPMDVTTVVLTHRPPADRPVADDNFVFVTGGIEEAVATAQKIAGDKTVGLNGGQIARQALEAGLLDEVHIDLVPLLLGGGTPMFPGLGIAPTVLDGPISLSQGAGVTHLGYRVRKS